MRSRLHASVVIAPILFLVACEKTEAPATAPSAAPSATAPSGSPSSVAPSGSPSSTAAAPSTTAPAASTDAASAVPAATADAAAARAAGPTGTRSTTCEVEIFGTVEVPADAPKGKAVVYVAQDDCLSDKAATLGHIPVTASGGFAIEVFPKWGTDVTICGALEAPDGTATYYAKAVNKDRGGRFHAEAEGEVTFDGVKLSLKKGPPKKFVRETKPSRPE
jgi:hypothetical protein